MSETRRPRVALTQLHHLWEFLNNHREIAVGYNKSIQARDHSKRMWERAAEILNSVGEGAIKSGSEWAKYWVDMKAKLKRKNRVFIESRRRTGGGPATDFELSAIDRRFLSIVGEDYGCGLTGVQVDPQVSLALQEYEGMMAGSNNPDTSQSTATEEAIYLAVEISDEYQQNEPHQSVDSVASAPAHNYQAHVDENVPSCADPQPSPSRQGTTGQGRTHILPAETDPQPSPSRQGNSTRSARRRLVLSAEADPLLSRQGARPRRRRQGQQMSAADARERLVSSSERRAQAELANSLSIEKGVALLGEMVSILRNIQTSFSGADARGAQRDPAL